MSSSRNVKPRKARAQRTAGVSLVRGEADLLHELKNTLASLRLRLGVVTSDPTCRWAQQDNLTALNRIVEEAMRLAGELRESRTAPLAAPPLRRGAKTPRNPRSET